MHIHNHIYICAFRSKNLLCEKEENTLCPTLLVRKKFFFDLKSCSHMGTDFGVCGHTVSIK